MEKGNKSNGFNKHSIWCSQVNNIVAQKSCIIIVLLTPSFTVPDKHTHPFHTDSWDTLQSIMINKGSPRKQQWFNLDEQHCALTQNSELHWVYRSTLNFELHHSDFLNIVLYCIVLCALIKVISTMWRHHVLLSDSHLDRFHIDLEIGLFGSGCASNCE